MEHLDRLMGLKPQPFDPNQPKFDQSTFYGRFRVFVDKINPTSLLYSKEKAAEAKAILDTYDPAQCVHSDQELWHAKWLTEATYHPDTKEPIIPMFRFASFVPANIPIMVGMLLSPKTPFSIPFWQTVNQTFNVGFNYSNRSINNPFTNLQLGLSYLAATSSSVAIAMALDKWIVKRGGSNPIIRTVGPFLAVATSGCINLLIIRYRELLEGVKVYDGQGNSLGLSKQAAWDGLSKTTGIRFCMQLPLIFGPVLTTAALHSLSLLPAAGVPRLLADVAIVAGNLFVFLPACFAAYPQILCQEKLEDHFSSNDKFYYNRGL